MLFCVRDRKAKVFHVPFCDLNKVQAQRGFETATKQANSPFASYPDDYELLYLGTFNEATGKIEQLEFPEIICSPRDFIPAVTPMPTSVGQLRDAAQVAQQ